MAFDIRFCGHCIQRAKKEYFFHIYSWHNLDGLEQSGEESWDELFPTENVNVETHGPKYVTYRLTASPISYV